MTTSSRTGSSRSQRSIYQRNKTRKGALIGSGVCASHGMERTHIKGLEATLKLMYLYLCGEE